MISASSYKVATLPSQSPSFSVVLVQRPANGLDNLYQEWFADIRPAKRLGQGLVKEGDERQNPAFEFFG